MTPYAFTETVLLTSYRDVSPWYEYRTRIKKVVISAGITGIGGASFWNCQNLTSVFLASTVTELGTCAFADCICLKSITFSAKTKIIGAEAFQGCTNLKEIVSSFSKCYSILCV